MATRKELVAAISSRYRIASRSEKQRILDEFVATTGFHRKHAIRALRADAAAAAPPAVRNGIKVRLLYECDQLDPVALLRGIRAAQEKLRAICAGVMAAPDSSPSHVDVESFLSSLATAWKSGEMRPTHRQKAATSRTWRTRVDPLAERWPEFEQWLNDEPTLTGRELLERLASMSPNATTGKAQLRTLQQRINCGAPIAQSL